MHRSSFLYAELIEAHLFLQVPFIVIITLTLIRKILHSSIVIRHTQKSKTQHQCFSFIRQNSLNHCFRNSSMPVCSSLLFILSLKVLSILGALLSLKQSQRFLSANKTQHQCLRYCLIALGTLMLCFCKCLSSFQSYLFNRSSPSIQNNIIRHTQNQNPSISVLVLFATISPIIVSAIAQCQSAVATYLFYLLEFYQFLGHCYHSNNHNIFFQRIKHNTNACATASSH